MLSCSCDSERYSGWWYYPPDQFSIFNKSRRKKCCSCGKLIDIGAQCVEFDRSRPPLSDIEERISGDEVPLASWYMCDWCGEMYFNFEALGYCIILGDRMKEILEDYWDITNFKRKNLKSP